MRSHLGKFWWMVQRPSIELRIWVTSSPFTQWIPPSSTLETWNIVFTLGSLAPPSNGLLSLAAYSVANRSSAGWATSRCLGAWAFVAALRVAQEVLTSGNSSPKQIEHVVLVYRAWSEWAFLLACRPASPHRWASPCMGIIRLLLPHQSSLEGLPSG